MLPRELVNEIYEFGGAYLAFRLRGELAAWTKRFQILRELFIWNDLAQVLIDHGDGVDVALLCEHFYELTRLGVKQILLLKICDTNLIFILLSVWSWTTERCRWVREVRVAGSTLFLEGFLARRARCQQLVDHACFEAFKVPIVLVEHQSA